MNLFQTLLRPDHEENPERTEVAKAANILQVGEFQLLQLAYFKWHGQDLPVALVDRLFTNYMLHSEVPHWVRHYARRIIEDAGQGVININDPWFHRYDHDYHTWVPQGLQRFCIAVAGLIIVVFGSIYMANRVVDSPTSMLPPYFEKKDLRQTLPDMNMKTDYNEHFIAPGGAGNFSDVSRGRR